MALTWTHLPRLAAPAVDRLVGRPLLWRARAPGRRLHLTFDDGPDPETTPALLDLLARHGATASFFFLGERAARHPALVRAAAAAGHTVGQHTHTHPDAWRTAPRRLRADLAAGTAAVEDALGAAARWMRFPYGHVTRGGVRWSAEAGQRVVMWDLMPGDFARGATPERVGAAVGRLARPGSVVVLHEGGRAGRTALGALRAGLGRWRAAGWQLDGLGAAS